MRKSHYFSIALFFLTIAFWVISFGAATGFCWSPSAQHGIGCFTWETINALGTFLFIIPAWILLIRGERTRESTKISTLSILGVIIGTIVSILAIWNFVLWRDVWWFDARVQYYRFQKSLPPGEAFLCMKDSDCPQGFVCVGRDPTKPSSGNSGLCLSEKQKQGVQ